MKKLDFPVLNQTYEWDCGPKALQAVLRYYGIDVRAEILIKYAKTDDKEGTLSSNMVNVLKRFKMKIEVKGMTIDDLIYYIDKKTPVIILLQAWGPKGVDYSNDFENGHWVIVIGYDKSRIIFEDPYSFKRTFLKKEELKKRWHSKENNKKILNYGIAVFGKKKYNPRKIIHMD